MDMGYSRLSLYLEVSVAMVARDRDVAEGMLAIMLPQALTWRTHLDQQKMKG